MDLIRLLADAGPVARLQRWCGVEYEKPITCNQETQTRRESFDSHSDVKEDQQSSCSKEVNTNSLQEGVQNADQNDVTSCSTVTHEDSDSKTTDSKLHERHIPIQVRELSERNNNSYPVSRSYNSSSDCSQNQTTNYKTHEIKRKNGYHILQPSSELCRKSSTSECNGNSIELNSSKDDAGDDASGDSDSTLFSTPTPAIRIKYKSLLYVARFGAFLGNELFYLTFFPFIIWNFDALIVRQVSMLWCVVMYMGQATKDYLRWPRPPCPPVVRLEIHYSREYSMPSTHAMAGTAIPLYLAYLAVERYQVPVVVAGILALMWFTVTCWSRLYLGVHSILDLLVGCVYALVIFFTFLGYVEGYDLYQQTHPFGAPVLLFTALTMCTVLYPTHHKNSSKADAVQIVSAYTGLGIGSWLGYQLGYMQVSDISQPYYIVVPTLGWCAMAFLRFISGVAVLGFLHTVTKWWSIRFYSYIYGLDVPDKTYPGVMIAYKFTTYAIVGAGAALFAPLVHLQLGIHRPALFYEVL